MPRLGPDVDVVQQGILQVERWSFFRQTRCHWMLNGRAEPTQAMNGRQERNQIQKSRDYSPGPQVRMKHNQKNDMIISVIGQSKQPVKNTLRNLAFMKNMCTNDDLMTFYLARCRYEETKMQN